MGPCKICGSDWHNGEQCPLAPDIDEKVFELPRPKNKDDNLKPPPGKEYLLPVELRYYDEVWVFKGT